MTAPRILIVEDDGIIGHHIQNVLTRLDYQVVGIASSGLEALELCDQEHPDLILMDINLQGVMDGVDVTEQIHRKSDTPVIYLTAYADEKTLKRAKVSDPFGYILKPFDERTLHATIIIALHKHDLERTLRESEERFRTLVQNQGEGLVIVDPDEVFKFANLAANEIFGLPEGGLDGRSMAEFTSPHQLSRITQQTLLRSQGERNSYEIEISRADGKIRNLVVVATPWFEKDGVFVGTCAILRDVTEQKSIMQREHDQRSLAEALSETAAAITSTLKLDEVLERVLLSLEKVVPYDSALFFLMDGDTCRVAGIRDLTDTIQQARLLHTSLPIQDLPAVQTVVQTGQPVVINETSWPDQLPSHPDSGSLKSLLGMPITASQRTTGVLVISSQTAGFFTPQHIDRLGVFANQAAIALENARLYHEAQERASYLSLLNDLTEIAIQSESFHEMLASLAERVGKLFKADGIYITFWDEASKGTIQGAAYGLDSADYARSSGKPQEHTLTASVLEQVQPLAVEDVNNTPYIDPAVSAEFPVNSLLGLPLLADGEKLGAMLIGYVETHRFTPSEIDRGMQIARQVALALYKGRLLDQERKHSRELARTNELIKALANIAARIEAVPSPDYVMETLTSELRTLGSLCVLSLKDPKSGLYHIRYSTIPFENLDLDPQLTNINLESVQTAFDASTFFRQMIQKSEPQYFGNSRGFVTDLIGLNVPIATLQRMLITVGIDENMPMMYLPLIVSESEIGRMWLWSDRLEPNDLPVHSIFASQVAIALENARLYAEVRTLAMTDDLTGLYNRRQLFQIARQEIEKARAYAQDLSLIIVDLDEFKAVNDTYGHVVGDEVVVEVANRCRLHARKSDLLGRYGGDEFIILLPNTDLQAAATVAERLREMIQTRAVKTTGGDVFITASLGVASIAEDTTDLVSLLIHADKSLYAAKQSGRNKVVVR